MKTIAPSKLSTPAVVADLERLAQQVERAHTAVSNANANYEGMQNEDSTRDNAIVDCLQLAQTALSNAIRALENARDFAR